MLCVETIQVLVCGQPGIENEVLRWFAVLPGPELDKTEYLVSFLTFADISVGIAEDMAVGILCQEGEDPCLSPAAS